MKLENAVTPDWKRLSMRYCVLTFVVQSFLRLEVWQSASPVLGRQTPLLLVWPMDLSVFEPKTFTLRQ